MSGGASGGFSLGCPRRADLPCCPRRSGVAQLPLDEESGYRGAVELGAGIFTLRTPLTISASGVVLRGSGEGSGVAGTTLFSALAERHSIITVSGSQSFEWKWGTRRPSKQRDHCSSNQRP